ncbi:MAG TPA: peptide-methionine (R)-S-oxide reductase [Methanomicrobia archaeon]|nr:peptide-methionine (R)-S-oxide reductase [Methanomicrobia archaeon]
MSYEIEKSDSEWKEELTAEEYRVLRKKGTELAFSGELVHNKDKGVYTCAGCGQELFTSGEKFDSGSGWPSFWDAIDRDRIEFKRDLSHSMVRTEIVCSRCGGHLGHVFDDGPHPTGKRYCVNSAALHFEKKE